MHHYKLLIAQRIRRPGYRKNQFLIPVNTRNTIPEGFTAGRSVRCSIPFFIIPDSHKNILFIRNQHKFTHPVMDRIEIE